MKKIRFLALILFVAFTLTSCATILGGKVSACQKTKPAPGQPSREMRIGALIADICLGVVWVAVDFGTGAIYKPCK